MENSKEILFVTAYKDIKRNSWLASSKSNEEYFKNFDRLATKINYDLVVFLEEPYLTALIEKYKHKKNIFFEDLSKVNTFLNQYLDKDLQIIKSKKYKNKIPEHRKNLPEHLYSDYNLINHSKINFVNFANKTYENYNFYSWIDFGMIRQNNLNSIPSNINLKGIPLDKITYQFKLMPPKKRIDPDLILQGLPKAVNNIVVNGVYVMGSAFICPKDFAPVFEKKWESKLLSFYENDITDDDQSLILQIYYDDPDFFCAKVSANWFNLYNIL